MFFFHHLLITCNFFITLAYVFFDWLILIAIFKLGNIILTVEKVYFALKQ